LAEPYGGDDKRCDDENAGNDKSTSNDNSNRIRHQLTTPPLSSPPSSRMSLSPPTNGPNGFSSSPSPSSIPSEIHLSIRLYASRGWPVTYFQKALLEYLQPLDLFWLLCSAHRVLKFLIGNTSILTIVYHATLLSGPSPRPPDSGIEDMNQPPF
jgi:hypothetical protein